MDEFRRTSDGQSFHMMKFSSFLSLYGVSKEVVAEVREEESKHHACEGNVVISNGSVLTSLHRDNVAPCLLRINLSGELDFHVYMSNGEFFCMGSGRSLRYNASLPLQNVTEGDGRAYCNGMTPRWFQGGIQFLGGHDNLTSNVEVPLTFAGSLRGFNMDASPEGQTLFKITFSGKANAIARLDNDFQRVEYNILSAT